MSINVYFVVQEKTLALDLAGPTEVLRIANRVLEKQHQPPAFCLHYVGEAATATLSTGTTIADLLPLPSPFDICLPAWIVLLGQEGEQATNPSLPKNQAFISWIRQFSAIPHLQWLTICSGSIWLAHAGLLRNRQATTHHLNLEELAAAEPLCHVQDDCVFVEDGHIASSAGVSTGIDLMVHKVAKQCGELVAAEVAQWLVMPQRRGRQDKRFSPLLVHRQHLHAALHRVQKAIAESPQCDWDIKSMAELACTSPRHLSRLFDEHAGVSPMVYVKQVRLQVAKSALQAGHSVTQAAEIAGFHSDTQLRRAWQALGVPDTPSIYAKKQETS